MNLRKFWHHYLLVNISPDRKQFRIKNLWQAFYPRKFSNSDDLRISYPEIMIIREPSMTTGRNYDSRKWSVRWALAGITIWCINSDSPSGLCCCFYWSISGPYCIIVTCSLMILTYLWTKSYTCSFASLRIIFKQRNIETAKFWAGPRAEPFSLTNQNKSN